MKVLQNTFVQELYKKSGREPIEYSYLELVNMTKDFSKFIWEKNLQMQ